MYSRFVATTGMQRRMPETWVLVRRHDVGYRCVNPMSPQTCNPALLADLICSRFVFCQREMFAKNTDHILTPHATDGRRPSSRALCLNPQNVIVETRLHSGIRENCFANLNAKTKTPMAKIVVAGDS